MKINSLLLCGLCAALPSLASTAGASAPAAADVRPTPLDPAARDSLLATANQLWREGRDDGARVLFERLMESNGGEIPVLAAIGDWQLGTGRDKEAEATGRALVAADPGAAAGPLLLGRVAMLYGRLDDAATLLAAAFQLDPGRVDGAVLHARLLEMSGRRKSAAEVLRLAREKAPPASLTILYGEAVDLTPVIAEKTGLLRELAGRRPDLAERINIKIAQLEALGVERLGEGRLAGAQAVLSGKSIEGGWTMPATIDGKPATLMFASACPQLILTPAAAERLGLKTVAGLHDGLGQPNGLARTVKLGGLTLSAVPVAPAGGPLPAGVDGVFGLALLRDFVVGVSPYDARLVVLPESTPPQEDNNTTPIWFDKGVPLVQVLFDGRGPLLMRLDTGVPAGAINRNWMSLLGLQAEGPKIPSPHAFSFAGMTMEMPEIPALPLSDGLFRHMGMIGLNNLPPIFEVRASKGYVSYPAISVLPASAPGSAPRAKPAGAPRAGKPKPRP